MKKISEHISYKEATHSNYAKQYNIDNKPKAEHIKNMEILAEKVFEPLRGKSNLEMFHYIKDNLDFDQLIWEFGVEPIWLHVSYKNKKDNRKQVLVIKRKGKYVTYTDCNNC